MSPASHETAKVDITFDIDASGIVYITAKDVATGEERESK